ncbi:MAG: MBL fold metallo-hydrolase [Hahellaceae bacterium]|nr:MBL fold metallo-hydrolase [Hahellaceae bacterium]MCP5170608.1 MBL fold metallo-hydrolase [Hahellaceae bacterium]
MKLRFLGAAGTVTGSRYLIEVSGKRILVDCGLYQGVKKLRLKNWQSFPVDPATIDSVIITHAHIDHSGYIPALVKQGYKGSIICTHATHELCNVLLPDAGYLQEEDARYANHKRFSKHSPALPLYTEADARASLKHFKSVHFNEAIELFPGVSVTFAPAGHILGASSVSVHANNKTLVFSGDVGRQDDLVMYPPTPLQTADYLVVESTYGDRLHEMIDAFAFLTKIINETVQRGGVVLLPTFAVGRAQTLLYIIEQLQAQDKIPRVPVYLNSPMAITATEIFSKYHKEHKLSAQDCHKIDQNTHFVRTAEESIALNTKHYPCVILSASGMASGGRVLHHLKTLLPNHKNSIIFTGFQAPGTRGDALTHGAKEVKIHGEYRPVQADIYHLDSLSAHGDYNEIIAWLATSEIKPQKVFVTHGEEAAADAMRCHLKRRFGWDVTVPEQGEEVVLD